MATEEADVLLAAARKFARDTLDDDTFAHAERVAQLVSRWTCDPYIIAAAWLHDVVEDGPPDTHEELGLVFDEAIVLLVEELTDAFTPEDMPCHNRMLRKAHEARRLHGCTPAARLVKLADVMDNDARIEAKGDEFAKVWRAEREALVWALL